MTRIINIESLRLRVPSESAPKDRSAGEALARSVAAGLARSLAQIPMAGDRGSLDAVRVAVPRGRAHADGVVQAVHGSINQALTARRRP